VGIGGARVGVAYASTDIIALMDKTKPPYNVSALNQEEALRALSNPSNLNGNLSILEQVHCWKKVERIFTGTSCLSSDAKFLLWK
jgi:histidinol-phosphate aminotransferase